MNFLNTQHLTEQDVGKLAGGIAGMMAATIYAGAALAGPVISNGSFETLTSGSAPSGLVTTGAGTYINGAQATLAGWSNSDSYSFVSNGAYATNVAGASGASTNGVNIGYGYNSNIVLYGPTSGLASPDGGNFIAADGSSALQNRGALSQTVSGLKIGETYAISFYEAAAEQNASVNGVPYNAATTEQWLVGFGGTSKSSQVLNTPAESYSAWIKQTILFTADSTSDLLSFFANGGPAGAPPFVLLDGVSIADVPEPSTVALMLAAMGGLVLAYRKRAARIG